MPEDKGCGPGKIGDLTRRLGQLDVDGLRQRLDALDRDPGAGEPEFHAALAHARQALEAARTQGLGADIHAARQAELEDLETQVTRKLQGPRDAPTLAQGLRRLAAALRPAELAERWALSATGETPGQLGAAIEKAREAGARALATQLGLRIMPVAPGDRIDPPRHQVVGTRTASDPALDNTVCCVEDAGWLLGEEILVRAEVVRFVAEGGALPTLPDLSELPAERLDAGILGRKTSGQE